MRFGEFLATKGVLDPSGVRRVLSTKASTNVWFGTLAYILDYLDFEVIGDVLGQQRESGLKFGEQAVQMGLLDDEQVQHVLDLQERKRVKFGEIAVSLQYLPKEQLARYLEEFRNLPGDATLDEATDESEGTASETTRQVLDRPADGDS